MKRAFTTFFAVAIGITVAALIISKRQATHYAALWAERQAAWQAEKSELEAALAQAQRQPRPAAVSATTTPAAIPALPARPTPQEIIAKLQALRLAPGANPSRTLRQAVYWLEELAQMGPAALPAIRECIARYEDMDLDTSWAQGRGARDRVPLDFTLPPSLRFGLFDVVRQIGGADAEKILGEALVATGRGVEVAYLARVLQEIAPGKYREQALTTTRALLASASSFTSASPLDRNHRDLLYGVLSFYGDTGFASEAQTQLVRADSQIDRSALKYLQDSLGAKSVAIASQTYQNPILTNSAGKEPLARLALNFVGADAQANEFYQKAINDPLLTRDHRRNLIEDLNQDGFPDTRNLTERDLPLIQNRIALIEQLAPGAMDDINAAAFKEAYKDLVNMRDRVLRPPPPAGNPGTGKP